MRRWLVIALLMTALARPMLAGEVGGTLGKYSVAGMGVGALLGSAAATLPYLQSQEPYDFLVGAGLGMLVGASVGFVLGVVDLANPAATAAAPADGWALAWHPKALQARYSISF